MHKKLGAIVAAFLVIALAFPTWAATPPPFRVASTVQVFCRNSADDVAINAAIVTQNAKATGGIVAIDGQCDITTSILPLSNVWIRGGGVGATTLKLHAGLAYSNHANVIFAQASSSANLTNWGVSDMTIDGNRTNQSTLLYGSGNASIAVTIPYVVTGGSNDTVTFKIDGGATKTATISAGTYSTLQALVAQVHTAVVAATATADILQFGGKLSLLSISGGSGSNVSSIAGNGAAGLFGTPTYAAGTTDDAFDGIEVSGNGDGVHTVSNFFIQRVESKSNGYHGIAIYAGVSDFSITDNNLHDNNFRCAHVHANGTGAGTDYRYDVSRNLCHDDGQGIMLPATGGTGLFVFFDGDRDATISFNKIWNEPNGALDVTGDSSGTSNVADNVIVSNNQVMSSGSGITVAPGSQAAITGVTAANNAARDISYPFILGSAAASLTITINSNDTLAVTLGGTTNQVVIAPAVYGSAAALATAVQTAINTSFAATGSGVTVSAPTAPAGFIYAVPIFTNGNINNAFSIAAGATHSALTTVFGATPTQYGGTNPNQTLATGICFSATGNGTAAYADVAFSGNRALRCASWGMKLSGGGAGTLATKVTATGNIVDTAGLDYSVNSGGMLAQHIKGYSLTGNQLFNNNTLAAGGTQLTLGANATQGTITSNYIDTILAAAATTPLTTASTASYNTFVGNHINRNTGTGNQFSNTGVGNTFAFNTLGAAGAGVFSNTGTGMLAANLLMSTSGAIVGNPHTVTGTCTLSSGTCTVTLTNAAVFTSSATYWCAVNDTTATAVASAINTNGTTFVINGTGTDVVAYSCVGN